LNAELAEGALDAFNFRLVFHLLNIGFTIRVVRGQDATESALILVLRARSHVEGGEKALGVVDDTSLLAHGSLLSFFDVNWWADGFKAIKTAGNLVLQALLNIPWINHALSKIDGTVLLACANSSLDISDGMADDSALGLGGGLEALEGATSLSLGAFLHIESGDEALGVVDSTVLLANSHLASEIDGGIFLLEARFSANVLGVNALLIVICAKGLVGLLGLLKKALSKCATAVFIAHIKLLICEGDCGKGEAHKSEKNFSHLFFIL
jgi:hypothetical protein